MSPFTSWENFYVIIGSSAAALTGLQFVVIALIAEDRTRPTAGAVSAYSTPTVVHFCAVLLVSAILSAPWHSLWSPALALAACGIAGTAYAALAARRALRQTEYQPVSEDWVWHAVIPFLAYAALVVSAATLRRHPYPALFVTGTAALALLFAGIHNSWDAVTYIAVDRKEQQSKRPGRG